MLWGLASHAEGDARFVASAVVTAQLQPLLAVCALIVGTEEEIRVAGGDLDTLAALNNIRSMSSALIVLKSGAKGCVAFPATIDDGVVSRGFAVDVFNVLGAGDAFMAGFLSGWLRGRPLAECCTMANACGAIVVSRHGCSPAMATRAELDYFLRRKTSLTRLRDDVELEHVHRATTRPPGFARLSILAFDHRSQLERIAQDEGAAFERIDVGSAL